MIAARRWVIVGALVVVVAALGLAFGAAIALRGRSLNAPLGPDAAGRPTFVVATAPSPSAAPSQSPSPPVGATSADDYVVAPGDTLRSIADRLYGDPAQWSRIYDANRATIGSDPDAISAGMHLRIPRS